MKPFSMPIRDKSEPRSANIRLLRSGRHSFRQGVTSPFATSLPLRSFAMSPVALPLSNSFSGRFEPGKTHHRRKKNTLFLPKNTQKHIGGRGEACSPHFSTPPRRQSLFPSSIRGSLLSPSEPLFRALSRYFTFFR